MGKIGRLARQQNLRGIGGSCLYIHSGVCILSSHSLAALTLVDLVYRASCPTRKTECVSSNVKPMDARVSASNEAPDFLLSALQIELTPLTIPLFPFIF
jgi:hypothetical protein